MRFPSTRYACRRRFSITSAHFRPLLPPSTLAATLSPNHSPHTVCVESGDSRARVKAPSPPFFSLFLGGTNDGTRAGDAPVRNGLLRLTIASGSLMEEAVAPIVRRSLPPEWQSRCREGEKKLPSGPIGPPPAQSRAEAGPRTVLPLLLLIHLVMRCRRRRHFRWYQVNRKAGADSPIKSC